MGARSITLAAGQQWLGQRRDLELACLRVLLGPLACDCFLSLLGQLEGFGHGGGFGMRRRRDNVQRPVEMYPEVRKATPGHQPLCVLSRSIKCARTCRSPGRKLP